MKKPAAAHARDYPQACLHAKHTLAHTEGLGMAGRQAARRAQLQPLALPVKGSQLEGAVCDSPWRDGLTVRFTPWAKSSRLHRV